jgi:hypothetical protein
MSEAKFFDDDMSLGALLDGRHWDDLFPKKKVETFDPIYGRTPFKETFHIVARFERQTCLRCHSSTISFTGKFKDYIDKSVEHLDIIPDSMPHDKKLVIDLPVACCYNCA